MLSAEECRRVEEYCAKGEAGGEEEEEEGTDLPLAEPSKNPRIVRPGEEVFAEEPATGDSSSADLKRGEQGGEEAMHKIDNRR